MVTSALLFLGSLREVFLLFRRGLQSVCLHDFLVLHTFLWDNFLKTTCGLRGHGHLLH